MCAPIDARVPEPRRRRALALAAGVFALFALAGCATKPKRPEPPAEPAPVVHPTPPPVQRPAPPKPPVVVPPPPARNFGQEKARRKLELANEEGSSVGAGEVGYYLDVLLGRLKQRLGPDTSVVRQGQRIVVQLPASAAFPVGGTALTPALRSKLAALSQALIEYRRVLVSVYVRSDASVIGASNPRLAEQRAKVLAAYFGGAGIDPRRVLLAPSAAPRPGAARPGAAGRSRIEVELEPVVRPRARAPAPSSS
jgi:outer membrane protein OmpA-like peptidoglycan-associated protein